LKTLHIVFGLSAAGTLKMALSGSGDGAVGFGDDLSWGPIGSMDERVAWLDAECPMPGGWDWLPETHDNFWREVAQPADNRLIWLSSSSPDEVAGYLAYLERFSDLPASVIRPNEHIPPHPTLGPLLGTGSANAAELAEVLKNAERRPHRDDKNLFNRWADLRDEKALLRIMDGDRLVSAPVETYDSHLTRFVSDEWQKAVRVVGNALGALMDEHVRVNPDFLFSRMGALVRAGQIEAEGDMFGWDEDGRRVPAMVRMATH